MKGWGKGIGGGGGLGYGIWDGVVGGSRGWKVGFLGGVGHRGWGGGKRGIGRRDGDQDKVGSTGDAACGGRAL